MNVKDDPVVSALLKEFTVKPLTVDYADRVVAMFTLSFCDSEPMTRYIKMEYDAFRVFAEAVVNKAVKDELSTIVLHDNHVVACALVEDITNPLIMPQPITPKFDPIFTLLEKLSVEFFKDKVILPNQIAHLFITAVDGNYRGHKLSRLVNTAAMELALAKNYKFMCSEMTNILNEKGTINHLNTNILLMGSIIYSDFVFANQKPFAQLEGGANAYLWELAADMQLEYKQNNQLVLATIEQLKQDKAHK